MRGGGGDKKTEKVRLEEGGEMGGGECRWIAEKSYPHKVVLKRRSHGIATKRGEMGKETVLQT